jgi:hypothetical protein
MDTKKIVLLGISILIILASASFIYKNTGGVPVHTEPFVYVGNVMAAETAKLLENKGEVLVLVQKDESSEKLIQKQTNRFLDALKKTGVTVKATETLTDQQLGRGFGPDLGVGNTSESMGVSLELFFSLLEKYPGISAVVSFVGTPVVKQEDLSKFTETTPKLLVFAPFAFSAGLNIKQLLTENVVQVAIVNRFEALEHPEKEPSTPEEWFNISYQVVTPEKAEALPTF